MTQSIEKWPQKQSSFPILQISQGHLKVLETCPRKFQHTYLEQLNTPISPEEQAPLISGSRFHLLMQQRELGLPIEPLAATDEQLQAWVSTFLDAEPKILEIKALQAPVSSSAMKTAPFRQSEHLQTLAFQDFLLTTIYDLLIAEEQCAQILDWKTYPRPQNRNWLAQSWQTRLYLFVLAETSPYEPEQLSMTYWFFQTTDPQDVERPEPALQFQRFSYDRTSHEQTRQDLNRLLTQLRGWLADYEQGQPFPQVIESSKRCESCLFASRCHRNEPEQSPSASATLSTDLDQIPEIIL
jgi:hypothetical protein